MNSGMTITIVNRTNSKVVSLPLSLGSSWTEILNAISDREGYSRDDRPDWVLAAEYKTPTGRSVAEFTRLTDSFIIVVNGSYEIF